MHIYQKHIIDLLRGKDTLRYSQLQPEGVESSHFKYHLNQLMHDGLVAQVSRGCYALSQAGESFVDSLTEGSVLPTKTPKVITYTLLCDGINYYLQQKQKAPYRGSINLIGGKVHIGELPQVAAHREVLEKTGLELSDSSLAGVATIKISHDAELMSHVVAYVFVTEIVPGIEHRGLVEVAVSNISQAENLAPDTKDIILAIEQNEQPFVIDLDISY